MGLILKNNELLTFNSIWPTSLRRLSSLQLQSLPDQEYKKLRSAFYRRQLKLTNSKVNARKIARKLDRIRSPEFEKPFLPKSVMAGKKAECEILDSFVPDRKKRWIRPFKRTKSEAISLDSFSFIDKPNKTMKLLAEIALAECDQIGTSLDFDEERVFDIGPYLVLSIMHERMLRFLSGGRITNRVRKVLDAVGLSYKMGFNKFKDESRYLDVDAFPVKQKNRKGKERTKQVATDASTKEKVADEFVAKINKWLHQLKESEVLNADGRSFVLNLMSETLCNAERHSLPDGKDEGNWQIVGFMAKRRIDNSIDRDDPDNIKLACHLSVVSIGNTIAQSIETTDDETKSDMYAYVKKHKSRVFDADTLKTVYAVQDGISRIDQKNNPKGGVGLIDMVSFVNSMVENKTNTDAALAIISGSSCLLFKDEYCSYGHFEEDRRIQFFNDSNDITLPPNPHYVKKLDYFFPGTIISARFDLEQIEDAD